MNVNTKITASRNLRTVPRWVICPHIRSQNVAEHSFFVVEYVYEISRALFPEWSSELHLGVVLSAIEHDLDEVRTGDTPSSHKPKPDYSGLSPSQLVLKAADLLEALMFMRDEWKIGNTSMQEEWADCHIKFMDVWDTLNSPHKDLFFSKEIIPVLDEVGYAPF